MALSLACGPPASTVDQARVAAEPSTDGPTVDDQLASTVDATLTVDGSPVAMTVLDFQDEGDYVFVTVSDKPVPPDLELASFAAEGITGVQFAFVKDPIALDDYLPVMAAHPAFGFHLLKGVEFAGKSADAGVFDLKVGLAETQLDENTVALDIRAHTDLSSFRPCESRAATVDGAESEPATVFADYYTALLQCDFEKARSFMTESASTEWAALSEGRKAGLTMRAPAHIKVSEIQTRGDDFANVLIEAVPSDGSMTGVSMKRVGGAWKVAQAELSL